MYRLVVESLLGLRLDVDRLHFTPCMPAAWTEFTLHYRYRETMYHIVVRQRAADPERTAAPVVTLDGIAQQEAFVRLVDDHADHHVDVCVERAAAPAELLAVAGE
jgi:cellobiose phosphorylase